MIFVGNGLCAVPYIHHFGDFLPDQLQLLGFAPQLQSGLSGVIGLHNGGDHADPGDGDARKDIDVVPVQAADGVDGNGDGMADVPEGIGGGQDGLDLGGGGLDGSHAQIVCALLPGFQRLGDGLGGGADDPVRPQELPGQVDGQIALAQVDTLGIDGHRNIQPVVDDEGDAVCFRQLMDLLRQSQIFPGGFVLFPNLQEGHTSLEGRLRPAQEFFLGKTGAVGDEIQAGV